MSIKKHKAQTPKEINAANKAFWEKTSKQFSNEAKKYPHAVTHAASIMDRDSMIGREPISLEALTSDYVRMILEDKSASGKKGGNPEKEQKELIKNEWDEWQKDPRGKYKGRATEFSRAMQKKYFPHNEGFGDRTIERWCGVCKSNLKGK